MTTRKKVLTSALVVAALGGVTALGVFGLFSATTQNAGNEISSGTVALSDNDAGSALVNITGATPGDSWTQCIKVTYNGTLPADVRFYVTGAAGSLAPYMHLNLVQGNQTGGTFPNCTGFTADATNGTGQIYDGPAFGGPNVDYANGSVVNPFGQVAWNQGNSLVFKSILTLSASAPDLAQGATTGDFTIFWEARNDS